MFPLDYLRSRSFDNVRVSSVIYMMIWLLGLIVTFSSVVFLHEQGRLGLNGGFSVIILALLSVIILFLTYSDMEEIERLRGDEHDYPGWIGKWQEVLLRIVIVGCLLLSVGEFHTLVKLIVSGWNGGIDLSQSVLDLFNCGKKLPTNFTSVGLKHATLWRDEGVFIVGSSLTFFFICVWNFGAIYYRMQQHKIIYPMVQEKGSNVLCARYHLVSLRIVIYMIIGLISCLYWILVGLGASWIDTFAEIFLFVYFFSIAAAVCFRIEALRGGVETWLGRLFSPR